MPIPATPEAKLADLVDGLGGYVTRSSGDNDFVEMSTHEAVQFIGLRFDSTTDLESEVNEFIAPALVRMPWELYKREVLELGAELFYRRQARNGIVNVNQLDGAVTRIALDPYEASRKRLRDWLGAPFA